MKRYAMRRKSDGAIFPLLKSLETKDGFEKVELPAGKDKLKAKEPSPKAKKPARRRPSRAKAKAETATSKQTVDGEGVKNESDNSGLDTSGS